MPERQVLRVYRNADDCKPSTVARVRDAAHELGLPLPNAAVEQASKVVRAGGG